MRRVIKDLLVDVVRSALINAATEAGINAGKRLVKAPADTKPADPPKAD